MFLALLWGQFFWVLHPTWIHSQYYDYGWIVPPLAVWFFWRRWSDRSPQAGLQARSESEGSRSLLFVGLILLFCALSFVRILERFDPIWRIPLMLHAMVVVAATHLAFLRHGGAQFSIVFVPLTLFALTACPWPAQAENRIVGELTDLLLSVSAPISRAIGIPVELSGSALISGGQVVQIDEGCSGIRSFQSLLMTGLFVGEFLMLRWRWRALVIVFAVLYGFATNTLRATALTWIFVNQGQAAFDTYHDFVGFVAFGTAAGLLLATGRLFERPMQTSDPSTS